MRQLTLALFAASTVAFGSAHAAPAFGAQSHRLGGGAQESAEKAEKKAKPLLESVWAFFSFKLTASTEPVAGSGGVDSKTDVKNCDKAKGETAEIAKVETDSSGDHPKTPAFEPMYLAF